jgi:hypothetical protein
MQTFTNQRFKPRPEDSISADYTDYADYGSRNENGRQNNNVISRVAVSFNLHARETQERNLRNLCNLRILNWS